MGEFGSDDCLSTKIGLGYESFINERGRERDGEMSSRPPSGALSRSSQTSKLTIFTFSDPLELAPLLALLLIDELLIMIGAAPLGGLGGNGGRLECESGQIGSESSRFLSCMYSSIKLSNFVSTSSTCNEMRCVSLPVKRLIGSMMDAALTSLLEWKIRETLCCIAASLGIKFYGQLSPKHAITPHRTHLSFNFNNSRS